MTILVKIASRSRPDALIATVKSLVERLHPDGIPEIIVQVVIDDDQLEMYAGARRETEAMLAGKHTCLWRGGQSIGKIHACNRDTTRLPWDLVVLISDDFRCEADNWAGLLAASAADNPGRCLHFNDGRSGKALCTYPIMPRQVWEACGQWIYRPEYMSLCCDNEWTEYHTPVYFDTTLFRHDHNLYRARDYDDLDRVNDRFNKIDTATFKRRKAAGWPPNLPWLTIGVLTVPGRELDLRRLRIVLEPQLERVPGQVELLIDAGRTQTTGAKRQAILERAAGRYICFVDDDDLVPPNYVQLILEQIKPGWPVVDCVGFTGEYTVEGKNPRKFIHSLEYSKFDEVDGVFVRPPMHLNPIRVDVARICGGYDPEKQFGEDGDFALRARPLLKNQRFIPQTMYYYLKSPRNSLVDAGHRPAVAEGHRSPPSPGRRKGFRP